MLFIAIQPYVKNDFYVGIITTNYKALDRKEITIYNIIESKQEIKIASIEQKQLF